MGWPIESFPKDAPEDTRERTTTKCGLTLAGADRAIAR